MIRNRRPGSLNTFSKMLRQYAAPHEFLNVRTGKYYNILLKYDRAHKNDKSPQSLFFNITILLIQITRRRLGIMLTIQEAL